MFIVLLEWEIRKLEWVSIGMHLKSPPLKVPLNKQRFEVELKNNVFARTLFLFIIL